METLNIGALVIGYGDDPHKAVIGIIDAIVGESVSFQNVRLNNGSWVGYVVPFESLEQYRAITEGSFEIPVV